jgi:hypothetical protein
VYGGKADADGQYERIGSIRPAGVRVTACRQRGPASNTGNPSGGCCRNQPAPRESQAGPHGVAERPVRAKKPGNAG